MSKIEVIINGETLSITKQELFALASQGRIEPQTNLLVNGRLVTADKVKGIVFLPEEERLEIIDEPNIFAQANPANPSVYADNDTRQRQAASSKQMRQSRSSGKSSVIFKRLCFILGILLMLASVALQRYASHAESENRRLSANVDYAKERIDSVNRRASHARSLEEKSRIFAEENFNNLNAEYARSLSNQMSQPYSRNVIDDCRSFGKWGLIIGFILLIFASTGDSKEQKSKA